MNNRVVLGIDIGGTNTVYGLVCEDGRILHHQEIPTEGHNPAIGLVKRIETSVQYILDNHLELELYGIGVGAPNGNYFTGMIQDPPNLSWGNVDVINLFKKSYPRTCF